MLKVSILASIGRLLRALPPGAPDFIYIRLLRGRPLRYIANTVLVALIPQHIDIPEGRILLNQNDPVVSGALALNVYEPFETDIFRARLSVGMTVLDIGANLGYHTVIAAARVGAEGRVLSFEPEPHNFALLQKNVQRNAFRNVELHNVAVSDTTGACTLNLSDSNKGRHSLVRTRSDSAEFMSSIKVQTVTLDAFLEARGIPHVDIIKMDIEGAEPLALAGMARTLAQTSLTLLLEFSPSAIRASGKDPVALLTDLMRTGFRVAEIKESARTLVPITDPETFVQSLSRGMYTNLLCTKNSLNALRSSTWKQPQRMHRRS